MSVAFSRLGRFRKGPVAVFGLLGLLSSLQLAYFPFLQSWTDSSSYIDAAVCWAKGQPFDLSPYRSHGTSLFYVAALRMGALNWFGALIVTKFALFFMVFILNRFSALFFRGHSPELPWIATFLAIMNPNLYQYSQMLGSEFPGAFFLVIGFYFLFKDLDHKVSPINAILSGVFLGLSTLARPVQLILVLAPFLAILLWKRRSLLWASFLPFLLFLYMGYNLVARGFWGMNLSGGINTAGYSISLASTSGHLPLTGLERQTAEILRSFGTSDELVPFPLTGLWGPGSVMDLLGNKLGMDLATQNQVLKNVFYTSAINNPFGYFSLVGQGVVSFFKKTSDGFSQYFNPYLAYELPLAFTSGCLFPLGPQQCEGAYSSAIPREWLLKADSWLKRWYLVWQFCFVTSLLVLIPVVLLCYRRKAGLFFLCLMLLSQAASLALFFTFDARFRFAWELFTPCIVVLLASDLNRAFQRWRLERAAC